MQIKILNVKFRNFMSYGELWNEIYFDDGISTFLIGNNLDTNSANGCGKTSMFQALTYGLYNKSISNISLQRLINSTNAIKNTLMEVIVEWSKGDDLYRVHRKRGSETSVGLYKNDIDITPDSSGETDKTIEELLGISFELFSKIIVFSGNTTPFLEMSIGNQRTHIEELFNITILTEKAEKLRKVINSTDILISTEEAIIKEKTNALTAHKQRVHNAEQKVLSWEFTKEKDIVDLSTQLTSIEGIDFEEEEKLLLSQLQLIEELKILSDNISSKKREELRISKELSDKNKEHEHLVHNNCPYCLQLMPNASEKIKEIEQDINSISTILKEKQEYLQEIVSKQESKNDQLKEIEQKIKYPNLPKLLEIKNNVTLLHSKLDELQAANNPHFEIFEELEKELSNFNIDYSKLDSLKLLKEHQQFLLKLLTDKNSFIRKRIINKTIPFLNAQLNHYTGELGLPHVIKFFEDMSCSVEEYGRELDFGNLSGGEKKRVSLAMSLAFRDVLHHLHTKVNILFVDEIDASLDESGVEAVIKLLKKKTYEEQLSTWVVMHRSGLQNRFDRDVVVEKKNGFSSFYNETNK